MKLNVKMNILAILFTVFTSISIMIIFTATSTANYSEVAYHVHVQSLKNYYQIVEDDLDKITITLLDWTEWDATYDYIQGRYEDYISDNLPIASYEDLDLDHIAIFDESMSLVYGGSYDEDANTIIPLAPSLVQLLKDTGTGSGILNHRNELLFYSALPITDNDAVAPYKGLMTFSYHLDNSRIESLSQKINAPITASVISIDETVDYEILMSPNENAFGITLSFRHSQSSIGTGRIEIPLINEAPEKSLKLEIPFDNRIQILGREHVKDTVIIVILSLVLFGIVTAIAIKVLVINRVVSLSTQVDAITHNIALKNRVTLSGSDELDLLSKDINKMLDELDSVHDEIKWYANHDEMTGALNRRAGFKILEDHLGTHKDESESLTIAYIDIDGLKQVNDSYGHIEGDRLIIDMVTQIISTIGDLCDIIRIGGDEFILIFRNMDLTQTQSWMDLLTDAVKSFNQQKDRCANLSFSYGLATHQKGMAADALVEKADRKMYRDRILYREQPRKKE